MAARGVNFIATLLAQRHGTVYAANFGVPTMSCTVQPEAKYVLYRLETHHWHYRNMVFISSTYRQLHTINFQDNSETEIKKNDDEAYDYVMRQID